MKISFTGTREGMTSKQHDTVKRIIKDLQPDMVIHGDCVGADEEFHNIIIGIRGFTGSTPVIRTLPPSNEKYRANCNADIIDPPQDYLKRDRELAELCDRLIACPKESNERLRSGTWSTVRYARIRGKIIYLVLPNGEYR